MEIFITKKKIFGLNNYLDNIKEIKRMKVKKSLQINRAIDLIIEQIISWNLRIPNRATLGLMLNEMVINAVYHSHGLTQEKLERIPVELPDDKFVDIQFCYYQGRGNNGSRSFMFMIKYKKLDE